MFLALLLLGCPKATVPAGQRVVEDVSFQGNGKWFSPDGDRVLRDAIEQRETRRWVDAPLGRIDIGPIVGDAGLLDRGGLADDGVRIETWYAHNGWFDAEFVGWMERPRRRKLYGLHERVDLVGTVNPGEPSVLDADIEILGLEGMSGPLATSLRRVLRLKQGDRFTLEGYADSLAAVRSRLQERGYAYAEVAGRVDVRPDLRTVHVQITVTPGVACVFGNILFTGEGDVSEARLLQELDFKAGQGFRASKLAAARQRLYGLGVFALVELVPKLDSPGERKVPIEVRLQRRPSREVQFGPSFVVETNRQELSASVSYSDVDVFHKLVRWEASAKAGAATAMEFANEQPISEQFEQTLGPVASLSQRLTIPGLGGGRFELDGSASALLGVEPSYREAEVQGSPGLTYRPDRRIALAFAYRAKYHKYYDFDSIERLRRANSKLSAVIYPESLLSIIEQSLLWDARDDKLAPTRNYFFALTLGEAGGPLGGDFDFFRVTTDARAYRALPSGGTVFAGRLGGGLVLPFDPEAGVDVEERLYLGGGNSVRGWGDDRLGPYIEYPADDGTTLRENVGGNVQAFGSLEVRQRLPWSLGVVAFVDVGRVWDVIPRVDFSELQWTVGGGLRYTSPIGPIRLDLGVRLGDPEYFEDESRWALHFGLGEAF